MYDFSRWILPAQCHLLEHAFLFTGFPAALAQSVAGRGPVYNRAIACQTILEQPPFDGFDPHRNFACDYTFGQGPIEPMGFSGSGVWFDLDQMIWCGALSSGLLAS